MSRIANEVKNNKSSGSTVVNFMGGKNYTLSPLETLKMISASSIFGEPSYYRPSKEMPRQVDKLIGENDVLYNYQGRTTTQIMEDAIDKALDYDFYATLDWARDLRNEYNMRLNPQIIMVRAACHPKRAEFTASHPGVFADIQEEVMRRADEPSTQVAYYLYMNKSKAKMPTILKKTIANRLETASAYEINKYKNAEIGMIDTVRICHANSAAINDLMNGNLHVEENDNTWEQLRSQGMGWEQIFNSIHMGHMALLRNLRGVFCEVGDIEFCRKYLAKLKNGVPGGKQFPFRYYSAYKAVQQCHEINFQSMILSALEECMDISLDNMPKFKGRLMALSDNSGSAWGTIPTEYGSVKVAEIDNLSAVIAAARAEDGYVGKFGDKLKVYPISSRKGILAQAREISADEGREVGQSTEGGVWEFFDKAITKEEKWDHIFIFSDQQAGHGGLYGTSRQSEKYEQQGYGVGPKYSYGIAMMNVFEMIQTYRRKVNNYVNVYSIQTAGYDNMVVPEHAYRTSIFSGWNGNFLTFAAMVNEQWDSLDDLHRNKKKNNSYSWED